MHSWVQALVFTIGIGVMLFCYWPWQQGFDVDREKILPNLLELFMATGFLESVQTQQSNSNMIVTIGLGTAFIGILYFIQSLLMNRVSLSATGNQPNAVLFDINGAKKTGCRLITRQFGLPVIQEVPIVTTRFERVNGKTAAQIKAKIPVIRDTIAGFRRRNSGNLQGYFNRI